MHPEEESTSSLLDLGIKRNEWVSGGIQCLSWISFLEGLTPSKKAFDETTRERPDDCSGCINRTVYCEELRTSRW